MPPAADTTDSKLKNFLKKFTVLRGAPRELWIIYAAYILENLAYKVGAATVLTLWLSSDLGFGDQSAGARVAASRPPRCRSKNKRTKPTEPSIRAAWIRSVQITALIPPAMV